MPVEHPEEDSLFGSAVGEWGLSYEMSRVVRLVPPYTTFHVRPGLEFDEDAPRQRGVGVVAAP